MADWKIIGLSGLLSAALAVILLIVYFPLFFIGPLIGGFMAVYYSRGYEDYYEMDRKDGAVIGVLSGIIGGLITGLFFLLIPGILTTFVGVLNTHLGAFWNGLLAGYLIIQLTVVSGMILGSVGGIIGFNLKK
jgi:hypothetical protein